MHYIEYQSGIVQKLKDLAAHPLRLPSTNVHGTLGLRLHSVMSHIYIKQIPCINQANAQIKNNMFQH